MLMSRHCQGRAFPPDYYSMDDWLAGWTDTHSRLRAKRRHSTFVCQLAMPASLAATIPPHSCCVVAAFLRVACFNFHSFAFSHCVYCDFFIGFGG